MEHSRRINNLIEVLKEAKSYSETEFKVLLDEGESQRALFFAGLNGELSSHIQCLETYIGIQQQTKITHEPDHCPVCGRQTSEGKKGGKICFDCVNRKRGLK